MVATNVVARMPERWPTGTPIVRAKNKYNFFMFHANVAEEVFIDKVDNINNNKILDDKSWYELKIACAHPPRLSTSKCQDLEGSRAMKL